MVTLILPSKQRIDIEPNAVIAMIETNLLEETTQKSRKGVNIILFTGNQMALPDANGALMDFINRNRRDNPEFGNEDDILVLK